MIAEIMIASWALASAPASPCLNSTNAKLPFCDESRPVPDRVQDLLSRLTLDEKISQLTTGNGVNGGTSDNSIPRLGIPRYDWWSEGTHGVKGSYNAPPHTDFPFPITTAMSFNRTLWTATAHQIAREGRALYNINGGGLTFWAPVVNLARDPRWGRNIECPGEDPFLSAEYATSFVRGYQYSPEDPSHLLVGATCSTFVLSLGGYVR